jgi:GNAT superfamily N-acetyltransferase
MQVKVRRAREVDFEEIRALDQLCMPLDERVDLKDVDSHAWWVVRNQDSIAVAFAGCHIIDDGALQICLLSRAGVMPQARGRGIQKKLLKARIRWARDQGCDQVWTYTAHYNIASSNSLISSGFKLWRPYSWSGSTDVMSTENDTAWLYWHLPVEPTERGKQKRLSRTEE